jgi:diacylglycerol kinase family enzyme
MYADPQHRPEHPAPAMPQAEPGFVIVINPHSGQHASAQTRQLLSALFQEAGRECEFAPAHLGGADVQAVCDWAARRARERGAVLVASGGDGTLNAAAQAALTHGCAMGVIPQGTFNYFARAHGIAQDAEAAARALLRATARPVQVGLVNGHVFLVNASLGLYPQLLQDREAFKQQLGRRRWVAVLSALVTLFEWRRQLTLEIEADGDTVVLRTPTLFVGNNRLQLEQTGIEPEVAQRAGEGRLAAIVVRPIGSAAMLGLVLRGALGRLGEAEQVHSVALRALTVRPWRTRRVKLATDGEVRWTTAPLRFEVSAQPLMLMLPAEADRVPVE